MRKSRFSEEQIIAILEGVGGRGGVGRVVPAGIGGFLCSKTTKRVMFFI
jgi:hypothetical protein